MSETANRVRVKACPIEGGLVLSGVGFRMNVYFDQVAELRELARQLNDYADFIEEDLTTPDEPQKSGDEA